MKPFWRTIPTKIWLLGFILLIAVGLRFYRINDIPHGFYWDEAAITYNAWGISVWNRDEHGIKLPVSFKSYGDYKAPLLIYILAVIYKIFGLQPEIVRPLVAVLGTLAVGLVYLIARELEKLTHHDSGTLSLPAALLMAITPWAVNFSRIGSEAVLALVLTLAFIYFLFKARRHSAWLILSALAAAFSLYAYHSAKVFTMPFGLLLFLTYRKQLKLKLIPLGLSLLCGLVLLLPLALDSIKGQGLERGKSLIFFEAGQPAPIGLVSSRLIHNLGVQLSPAFWVEGQDAIGLRHNVPGHGVLYWSALALAILGLVSLLQKSPRLAGILMGWVGLGLLPAIISVDAPHAIRSMLALPAMVLLAAEGWSRLRKQFLQLIVGLVLLIEVGSYLQAYYSSYAITSAPAFQYGYKEAIITSESVGQTAEKFIMTDFYGQPYIYSLLYRKITPEEFKFGALANFEFHAINWPDERPNRVFLGTPAEIPPSDPHVVRTITVPDSNTILWVIAKT